MVDAAGNPNPDGIPDFPPGEAENEVVVGDYRIDHVVEGDSVTEVLRYVGYQPEDLVARVRKGLETAMRQKRMSRAEARQLLKAYQEGLSGYTYLERD